jgi:hypothetical protein
VLGKVLKKHMEDIHNLPQYAQIVPSHHNWRLAQSGVRFVFAAFEVHSSEQLSNAA